MTCPSDIFRESVNAMLCNVHTSLPGIVKSYDPNTNKATIQPALNKAFTSGTMPMPILENVPIIFPKNITFPIENGDYVLLIFAERSLDLWLSVGGQVTPTDPRKFDLSDAIAIPGLVPFTETYPDNNNQDFVIKYAGSSITIKQTGAILIDTASTVAIGTSTDELLKIVSDLLFQLSISVTTPVTNPIAGGGPLGVYDNLRTQIENIRGTIT